MKAAPKMATNHTADRYVQGDNSSIDRDKLTIYFLDS